MSGKRRVIPATELRVHLGEALRTLDDGEIVVEKGGVPVAVLRRWSGEREHAEEAELMGDTYGAALSKRARAGGLAAALEAVERGWSGVDAETLAASVLEARDAGVSDRAFTIGEDGDEESGDDGGEVPGRQRHLYRRARRPDTKVADDRTDPPYSR